MKSARKLWGLPSLYLTLILLPKSEAFMSSITSLDNRNFHLFAPFHVRRKFQHHQIEHNSKEEETLQVIAFVFSRKQKFFYDSSNVNSTVLLYGKKQRKCHNFHSHFAHFLRLLNSCCWCCYLLNFTAICMEIFEAWSR